MPIGSTGRLDTALMTAPEARIAGLPRQLDAWRQGVERMKVDGPPFPQYLARGRRLGGRRDRPAPAAA